MNFNKTSSAPQGMDADQPIRVSPLDDDIAAMAFVQSSALCRGVADEQLKQLYAGGEVLEYGLAKVIFSEGSTDDYLFVILEGSVTIQKQKGTALVELASLERPAIFGEMTVLTRQPSTASVVTRTDARLLRFRGEVVRQVADSSPKFGRKLAGLMAGRSKDAAKKLEK